MEELSDVGAHVKEVYAHFGLAFYLSSVFEAGLAIALMQADFLGGYKTKIQADGPSAFDRPQFEAEFDTFMAQQHAQTLGNLIKRLQAVRDVPEDLMLAVTRGKAMRDMLAHHFFPERAVAFATWAGRDSMLEELNRAELLFRELDDRIRASMAPVREEIGMRDEVLQPYIERFMRDLNTDL